MDAVLDLNTLFYTLNLQVRARTAKAGPSRERGYGLKGPSLPPSFVAVLQNT